MNPLISVIIPIYNVEKYLARCVDSVIAQTYENLEIILVDDGSPDKCPEICDGYAEKDSRVKVIHKQNGGLSSARNAGLVKCAGEYIYFLDSDDYITDDCIELLYSGLSSYDAQICVGKTRKFFDGDIVNVQRNEKREHVCSSGDDLLTHILDNSSSIDFVTAWNKLIRKDILRSISFPVGKYHEDEYFNWKIYNASDKVVLLNEETYLYYQRSSSITGDGFGAHNFDYLGALEERLDYFSKHKTEYLPFAVKNYRRSLVYYFYFRMVGLIGLPYSKAEIHKMFKESFSLYPYSLDRKLYSAFDRVMGFIFFVSPYFALLINKISVMLHLLLRK